MNERWRPISGFGNYEVSDRGRIRRVTDFVHRNGTIIRKAPYILVGAVNGTGYRLHRLRDDAGKYRSVKEHRAVAQAFLGAQPEGRPFVAHNDGDSLNNRLENLRWASPKENTEDRVRHGTMRFGVDVPTAKLTPEIAKRIRGDAHKLRRYGRNIALSEKYHVSTATIKRVLSGAGW